MTPGLLMQAVFQAGLSRDALAITRHGNAPAMRAPGFRAVEALARKQARAAPKICPRCGRILEQRRDGSYRCPTCARSPNECNCYRAVVADRGTLYQFQEIDERTGEVRVKEV